MLTASSTVPGSTAASSLLSLNTSSDEIYALTSYINADPEARAWLNGSPDPWGMIVNPNYKGITLPTSSSASGLGPMYGVIQDMSPPGPAMNPSSDIVTEYSVLAIAWNLRSSRN